jgi:hypothetical protein
VDSFTPDQPRRCRLRKQGQDSERLDRFDRGTLIYANRFTVVAHRDELVGHSLQNIGGQSEVHVRAGFYCGALCVTAARVRDIPCSKEVEEPWFNGQVVVASRASHAVAPITYLFSSVGVNLRMRFPFTDPSAVATIA